MKSSLSRYWIQAPLAALRARLRAALGPRFLPSSMIFHGFLKLVASLLRTTATVSSCEPSSATMSSKCGYVCADRLSIVPPTQRAAL